MASQISLYQGSFLIPTPSNFMPIAQLMQLLIAHLGIILMTAKARTGVQC